MSGDSNHSSLWKAEMGFSEVAIRYFSSSLPMTYITHEDEIQKGV